MNTTDVKEAVEFVDDVIVKNEGVDLLHAIFDRQQELLDKYIPMEHGRGLRFTDDCPVDLNDARGQCQLKDMAWRVTEELGEAMSCLKNKPWKETQVLTDEDHFLEELSDAFHFFLELCMLAGLSAKDLAIIYFQKSEVNKFRQRSKY